jgi:hypothetical protein
MSMNSVINKAFHLKISVTQVNEVSLLKEALNSSLSRTSNSTVLFLDPQGVQLPIVIIEANKLLIPSKDK